MDETDDDLELVQVRHEETAGSAATADVKHGGSPIGCCVVTSGPGALHALNGVRDALMDRVPPVVVLGQTALTARGGSSYQDVDLHSVSKDGGGAYLQTITDASQVRHTVDRACRTALSARAPTVLFVPSDVQDRDAVTEAPDEHGHFHTFAVPSSTVAAPPTADLARAAEVLDAGRKVAMLGTMPDAGSSRIPPHLTTSQALNTAAAGLPGDPAFSSIVKEGLRTSVLASAKARPGGVLGSSDD